MSHALVLFDGVCNLCNRSVRWIIRHDRRGVFRFAALRSGAAERALAEAGVRCRTDLPDSMVVIDERGVHVRSDAGIAIGSRLGFPWSLARAGRLVPRVIRDWAYDRVAKNRYRVFGRAESCMVPTADVRSRFVDADEPAAG